MQRENSRRWLINRGRRSRRGWTAAKASEASIRRSHPLLVFASGGTSPSVQSSSQNMTGPKKCPQNCPESMGPRVCYFKNSMNHFHIVSTKTELPSKIFWGKWVSKETVALSLFETTSIAHTHTHTSLRLRPLYSLLTVAPSLVSGM